MKYLYYLYQIVFALPLLLITTALTSATVVIGSALGDGRFWSYWPGKIWSRITLYTFLIPIHLKGRENIDKKTSYVFVANHQSFFDIFLIYGYLGHSFRWMMKKSLRKMPMIGKACESGGQIFVDKSGPKAIMRTYELARKELRGGTSLVVFPEGSRTYDGGLSTFKKGAFQLADELQLPIVPITINGPFDFYPRTAKAPLGRWTPFTIQIHKPIFPKGKGHENEMANLKEAYEVVMSGLPKERQRKAYKEDA